jgi:hypothetical protein
MAESVNKVIDLVGTSNESVESQYVVPGTSLQNLIKSYLHAYW